MRELVFPTEYQMFSLASLFFLALLISFSRSTLVLTTVLYRLHIGLHENALLRYRYNGL